MNALHDISDEEFVPFLHKLRVETYKKSFEWMLNEPDFAGVLRWLYSNLDHNNALTAREECRYIEMQKQDKLLSAEALGAIEASIQDKHHGICLSGDQEALEDVKLEITMQKERLSMLQKQEVTLKEMMKQNELIKEGLTLEVTKLNAAHQQCREDERTSADECLKLAEEIESITEGVIDVIADTLDVYGSCHSDKEIAKKFYTFGPFEAYRQSQALFRSHFDLYVSKHLAQRQNDVSDEDLRSALIEAKNLEERLSDAVIAYIESKAELIGEQAKVALVANYNNVHPSQITSYQVEAQTAVDLLEQEESILEQQLQSSVQSLLRSRTGSAVDVAARGALAARQQVHSSLTSLAGWWRSALALDRLLYRALRLELRAAEDCVQFAAGLRAHVRAEGGAVAARVEAMNEICAEHASTDLKLRTSDPLLLALSSLLGPLPDGAALARSYQELVEAVKELAEGVKEGYRRKEEAIAAFAARSPLRRLVWSGRTRQPRAGDAAAAGLLHAVTQRAAHTDRCVGDATSHFAKVKSGDKNNLRKLWQWFLTDEARFLSAMKNARAYT